MNVIYTGGGRNANAGVAEDTRREKRIRKVNTKSLRVSFAFSSAYPLRNKNYPFLLILTSAPIAIAVQMMLITIDGYDSLYHVLTIRKIAPVRFSTWNTIESDLNLPLLFRA